MESLLKFVDAVIDFTGPFVGMYELFRDDKEAKRHPQRDSLESLHSEPDMARFALSPSATHKRE
ncbi:hypothetical protein NOR_07109 [Metarhizium rileyi]|uniref:Uncharacterized protein n=1 Tax=Metarhizium rileyi (strain RCEF 4871) TaxID=1649241 RepID=A0A166Z0F7_METRR|nr:hypothetical protein NOR_07109 [Metarhizium rileyi RCEF 4871]